MTITIWNKYKKIKEVDNNSNIKTYLARIEPIIKEISYKNMNEYLLIREKIEKIKNKIKIYDIIEEEDKIFIVINNNNEIISEIDKLILKDKIEIKKEGILKEQGNPVSKNEVDELFKMEKSMCRIKFEKIDEKIDEKIKKGIASGFFCEIDADEFPIKYGLFTNNHVLDENDLKKGKIINIEILNEKSYTKYPIIIDEKRRVYTDKDLDYTCIEIFQSDPFKDYFKIDPILFNNKEYLKDSDIFILQYPEGHELCFSYGKVLSLKNNSIIHSASTKDGSSGSPIIRRSENNYIIGLHYGGIKEKGNIYYSFNLATSFDNILNDINKSKEEKVNQNKINNDIDNNKFNNIIYYDSNINFLNNINQDIDDFEKVTHGAFILCKNMNSFNIIRKEILLQTQKKRLTFNLITTGNECDNIMKFLNEYPEFKSLITHVCVYCQEIQNWLHLKIKYDLVYDVVTSKDKVINFIKNFSSEEIKPYQVTKVITLNDYLEKYKDKHIKIAQFYGDLSPETFKKNIEKMKLLIENEIKEGKLFASYKQVLDGFLTFDVKYDIENLDKLIIKEYTKELSYLPVLNKWHRDRNFNSFEVVAYFTARLMYSLNSYAKRENKYNNAYKQLVFSCKILPYSDILSYERAKGKIIVLYYFIATTQNEKIAKAFFNRTKTAKNVNVCIIASDFKVTFIIENNFKENLISNGIKIGQEFIPEEEILYQPYSFYYVRDVKIDLDCYKADIYLETIGKKEILEEKIKLGKEIKYNEKERIMEVE